jgi:hypothetical protein
MWRLIDIAKVEDVDISNLDDSVLTVLTQDMKSESCKVTEFRAIKLEFDASDQDDNTFFDSELKNGSCETNKNVNDRKNICKKRKSIQENLDCVEMCNLFKRLKLNNCKKEPASTPNDMSLEKSGQTLENVILEGQNIDDVACCVKTESKSEKDMNFQQQNHVLPSDSLKRMQKNNSLHSKCEPGDANNRRKTSQCNRREKNNSYYRQLVNNLPTLPPRFVQGAVSPLNFLCQLKQFCHHNNIRAPKIKLACSLYALGFYSDEFLPKK